MDQQKIGGFIASNRKSRGLTQAELAEQLGVTNKAVSKWETGRCLPDAELFQPLCALLGITVNELLTGEAIPPEQAAEKAEETIVSLAGHQQRTVHWRRLIRYAAFAAALVNMTYNLLGNVLPWLVGSEGMGVFLGLSRYFFDHHLSELLTLLHIVLWGAAMETNRENLFLQWVNLAYCALLPISAVAGIHAIPTQALTYKPDQIIRAGMPCVLLLIGLMWRFTNWRSLFYLSIALGTAGFAFSVRNLVVIHRNNKRKIKPDHPA